MSKTPPQLRAQLEVLPRLTTAELADRYQALAGEPPRTKNRRYLEKRVSWLLQSKHYGETLSDAARRRAHELARLSDIRLVPPEPDRIATKRVEVRSRREPSMPPPGTVLIREYNGREFRLTVLGSGFEMDGVVYRSLSAAAGAICGQHVSGPMWFGLVARKRKR